MRFQLGLMAMCMAVGCGPAVVVPNDDDDDATTTGPDTTSNTNDPMLTTVPPMTSASTTFSTSPPPTDDSGSSSSGFGTDEVTSIADTGSGTTGALCGNDFVEIPEQCDGTDLQGLSCEDLGYTGGDLACAPDCLFDTEMCFESDCGDGMVAPGEQCDGEDLQGFDCESLGLGGGMLACDPVTCSFDTSDCMG